MRRLRRECKRRDYGGFSHTNWTKFPYKRWVIITFQIPADESYLASISLSHARFYPGSGFNPVLQRNAALPLDGLRPNMRGISPARDSALNRCSSEHVQLSCSTWELESQTDTSSSLISGKEKAEVPGRGKTDGPVFLPAACTSSDSLQSRTNTVVDVGGSLHTLTPSLLLERLPQWKVMTETWHWPHVA